MRLLDGTEQWLLLHVEVQTTYETGFEFRIACYNAGLLCPRLKFNDESIKTKEHSPTKCVIALAEFGKLLFAIKLLFLRHD